MFNIFAGKNRGVGIFLAGKNWGVGTFLPVETGGRGHFAAQNEGLRLFYWSKIGAGTFSLEKRGSQYFAY